MKGDFSRLTFDPSKHFTRVLMQQGRVQLDADWNEQAAILLHYLERLAADLIGPFGGPEGEEAFAIGVVAGGATAAISDLTLGTGRYYVDGLLCENLDPKASYFTQPDLPLDRDQDKLPTASFLAYLDVWERHVTYVEDGSIREVALQGPDTATRARVVWQVRVTDKTPDGKTAFPAAARELTDQLWGDWVDVWQPPNRGSLQARAKLGGDPTNPCVAPPGARFRGLENQLYRVEVHTGGTAAAAAGEVGATFKWSRDNGSVTFPIVDIATESASSTTTLTLERLGREGRASLSQGDRVEIVDDDVALGKLPGVLAQVATVDAERARITLRQPPASTVGQDKAKHPLLRRWDYGPAAKVAPDGALPIVEGKGQDSWLDLEDDIQVFFQPAPAGAIHTYRAGDYWMIPARTATGNIEWPGTPDAPTPLPPRGVLHRFAPLALLVGGKPVELRRSFKRAAAQAPDVQTNNV
jgi:hypothetical protein